MMLITGAPLLFFILRLTSKYIKLLANMIVIAQRRTMDSGYLGVTNGKNKMSDVY